MFEQLGACLDQLVRVVPGFIGHNGSTLALTAIALFALRSFSRWGSYR